MDSERRSDRMINFQNLLQLSVHEMPPIFRKGSFVCHVFGGKVVRKKRPSTVLMIASDEVVTIAGTWRHQT